MKSPSEKWLNIFEEITLLWPPCRGSMDFPSKMWFDDITYTSGRHEKVYYSHNEAMLGDSARSKAVLTWLESGQRTENGLEFYHCGQKTGARVSLCRLGFERFKSAGTKRGNIGLSFQPL